MPGPDLPPLVQALLDPAAYPHPVPSVELRQTHISYVFLAGEYVYKVKKAVNFGFLDYSTLGKRRYYCNREVKLNRRLCADTYLGVVPIRESGGRFAVDGKQGRTAEYAVKMHRLPQERMLDTLIERGEATTGMVEAVAERLVPFHETTDSSPGIARYGDWAIRYNHRENVDQWTPYVDRTLSEKEHRILVAYGEAFFARKADVLRRRVEEQRIRRTHADLRSDAVCVQDGICIFDCVEFNRRISLLDVARDVGFLEMDLRYRDRPDLAEAFTRRYEKLADDPDLAEVLPFYAYYSACVRGKVENFLLDPPEIPAKEKRAAARRAKRYFDLAIEYAKTLPPALLVITYGLSASGKSALAGELATQMQAQVISSDVARKKMLGIMPEERAGDAYRAGIYTADVTERTYAALFEQARALLMDGRSVILDASFLKRKHRRAGMRLARETGAQFACVEVRAAEADVRRRMRKRAASGKGPSDADWEIYRQQKRRAERPSEVPRERMIQVDTSKAAKSQLREVVRQLREISPLSVRSSAAG